MLLQKKKKKKSGQILLNINFVLFFYFSKFHIMLRESSIEFLNSPIWYLFRELKDKSKKPQRVGWEGRRCIWKRKWKRDCMLKWSGNWKYTILTFKDKKWWCTLKRRDHHTKDYRGRSCRREKDSLTIYHFENLLDKVQVFLECKDQTIFWGLFLLILKSNLIFTKK
jgi:hypothetical protein